jgi:hypothetical protein
MFPAQRMAARLENIKKAIKSKLHFRCDICKASDIDMVMEIAYY